MSLSIVIPPYAEPVHINEAKNHVKGEVSITEDDSLIESRVSAARNIVETDTGANTDRIKVMLATTFDLKLHCFPWWNPLTSSPFSYIYLPRVPLISVTSITYVDTAGTTQTMSSSLYVVDYAKGIINLAYNESWPSTRSQPNAVTVRFVAGMAASFTAVAATDVLTILGRSFTVGDRVRLLNSGGALPTGLSTNTDYFVIAGGQLSLTSGGLAVDITGTGSGTHFIATALDMASFKTLQTAVMQKVALFYMHRGDGGISMAELNAVERLYDYCIASEHA